MLVNGLLHEFFSLVFIFNFLECVLIAICSRCWRTWAVHYGSWELMEQICESRGRIFDWDIYG